MPDFDLTGELSLKIELHMLRPITEKVHSGNGPVSLVEDEGWMQPAISKITILKNIFLKWSCILQYYVRNVTSSFYKQKPGEILILELRRKIQF